jgi:hypothetical protein
VPTIGVKRIELDVDNLSADINLNANVASLVTVNAGVALSVQKVNLTISDVGAELELIVRLGHLVDIVNRVFKSLDLNPLIIGVLNNVTSLVETAVGAVDGLLGSITQSGSTLNFLIDNLGNIVQEVLGGNGQQQASQIVGNYQNNMTYTGKSQQLQNGFIQKTYSYGPLNALVNIVFNSDGQIVQAVVVKQPGNAPGGGGGKGGSPPSNRPGGVSQGQGQAPPRAQPPQQAQGQAPPQGQAPQQVQGQAPPRAQAPPQAQAPAPAQAQAPAPAPAQAQVSAQAP